MAVWVPSLVTLSVTMVMLSCSRPILVRLGTYDVPNQRSSHAEVTLRGGGIGPLVGTALGLLCAVIIEGRDLGPLVVVLVSSALMGLVGLAEDVRGVPIRIRLFAQVLVGTGTASALSWGHSQAWIWILVGSLAYMAYVNFANFMDGINGISGLHGLVVGVFFSLLGATTSMEWLQSAGLVLAAAFIAFLPWNLRSPCMFLGDVGSYLLGGLIAAIALGAVYSGVNPLVALAPLSIYIADTCATILVRFRRGEPVLQAHRSHTYQRLTDTGWSHMRVSLLVASLTCIAGMIGLGVAANVIPPWVGLVLLLVTCGFYLLTPRMRGSIQSAPLSFDLAPVTEPDELCGREDWKPRVWAVVGASGFIGSAMADYLESQGDCIIKVRAPRLSLTGDTKSATAIAETARNSGQVSKLSAELKGADVVINCAGMANPDGANIESLFGANALLPAVVFEASKSAGAGRLVHLSSAAVQGNQDAIDATMQVWPFSAYSLSKVLGERALLAAIDDVHDDCDLVIVRATSVQGNGRATTEQLRRIARSPISSVASPGTQPTVVSSLNGLVEFICDVARCSTAQAAVQLQPWEGLSARDVLEAAGGKPPIILPAKLCRSLVGIGRFGSFVLPGLSGPVRRIELMWFGQNQADSRSAPAVSGAGLRALLHGEVRQ